MNHTETRAVFTNLINLASERLGAKTLAASDDFFAEKENLLKESKSIFIPDKYTDRGKWMDGWESRRKRTPGHDWCIMRLGLPGVIHGVDIDTSHFLGNHPAYASVDACKIDDLSGEKNLAESDLWKEILPRSPLAPGMQNMYTISDNSTWTHLRLNIYPDGGVARFRAYGSVTPKTIMDNEETDLIALENGGRAVACSDMFFSPMSNLIMPGKAQNMGEGWESRRRRGPGNDWVILKAAKPGIVNSIEVDTSHFKGNYPDYCTIDACHTTETVDSLNCHNLTWTQILDKQKLSAHHQHIFDNELIERGPFTHFRLNIYPDGGVSRLRINGKFV
ncbi:MAG: allantoicase [Balneolaceae bacterium]